MHFLTLFIGHDFIEFSFHFSEVHLATHRGCIKCISAAEAKFILWHPVAFVKYFKESGNVNSLVCLQWPTTVEGGIWGDSSQRRFDGFGFIQETLRRRWFLAASPNDSPIAGGSGDVCGYRGAIGHKRPQNFYTIHSLHALPQDSLKMITYDTLQTCVLSSKFLDWLN